MWQFKKQILIYILACRLPFFPRDVNKNLCSLAEPHPILSKDSERRGQRQIYLNYADLLLFFVKVIKSGKYDADFKNIMRCGGAVQVFTPE